MSGGARLGAFVGALVLVFVLALGVGRVAVPDGAAERWNDRIVTHDSGDGSVHDSGRESGGGEAGRESGGDSSDVGDDAGDAGHSSEDGHR